VSIRPEGYVFPDDPRQSLYPIEFDDLSHFTDDQIAHVVDDPAAMLAGCDMKIALGMIESVNTIVAPHESGTDSVVVEAILKPEAVVALGLSDELELEGYVEKDGRVTSGGGMVVQHEEDEARANRQRAMAQYKIMEWILERLQARYEEVYGGLG